MDVAGFALLAAILTMSPGQDTVLVLRNATAAGAAAGVATTTGVCSGLFFHATLSALGVSALLVASQGAFDALRWLGAAYVVWLGLQSLLRLRRGRRVELLALHFAMAFAWLSGVELLADRSRIVLARPRVLRSVDALAGVALVAFGLRLVLARC
jgi:threonine/homoserine/homoserine lactone efflux protein